MRVLDENKRKKISQAAIKLIVTEGFAATSMSKIAKEARVAASTIYLYFDNKEDMLEKVYLMVKRDFSCALFSRFDLNGPIKESMRTLFDNICGYFESHPLESSFMEQFENSALISKSLRDQAMLHFQPGLALVERGAKEKVLKKVSPLVVGAFLFHPVVSMIRRAHGDGVKVSRKEKEDIFNMLWDAIKK